MIATVEPAPEAMGKRRTLECLRESEVVRLRERAPDNARTLSGLQPRQWPAWGPTQTASRHASRRAVQQPRGGAAVRSYARRTRHSLPPGAARPPPSPLDVWRPRGFFEVMG